MSGSKFESARRETGAGELRRVYVHGVRTPQAHSPARWGIGGAKIVALDLSCRRPGPNAGASPEPPRGGQPPPTPVRPGAWGGRPSSNLPALRGLDPFESIRSVRADHDSGILSRQA